MGLKLIKLSNQGLVRCYKMWFDVKYVKPEKLIYFPLRFTQKILDVGVDLS